MGKIAFTQFIFQTPKETALALGIALKLNPEDMYRFMMSMEYNYPADERDYYISSLINSGEYDFKTVTVKYIICFLT